MSQYDKFNGVTTTVLIQTVTPIPISDKVKKAFWKVAGYVQESEENFEGSWFEAAPPDANVAVSVTFSVKGSYLNLKRAEAGKEATPPTTDPDAATGKESQQEAKGEEKKPETKFIPDPGKEKQGLKRQESTDVEIVDTKSQGIAMMLLHKAEIDTAIATAHAFPRSITKFIELATSYATYDAETAAGCSYALPRGNKIIDGPSVRLAEIVCSTYGNIRAEGRVIEITQDEVIARGVCMDLETNNTQSSEVRVKIKDRLGVRYNQDMITMTGNQAVAKARRNAIFMVVPGVFTKKIRQQAMKVAAGDEKTLPQRRDAAVAFFKNLKVTEAQICAVLEVKKINDITLEHYSILASMAQQIQNKENTVEELFSKQNDESRTEAQKAGNDALNQMDGKLQ